LLDHRIGNVHGLPDRERPGPQHGQHLVFHTDRGILQPESFNRLPEEILLESGIGMIEHKRGNENRRNQVNFQVKKMNPANDFPMIFAKKAAHRFLLLQSNFCGELISSFP
jgi:hypothetical protein